MKADPPVERNGTCAVCAGKRPQIAVRDADPFCSSGCCREFHGVVFLADARATGNRRTKKPTAAQIPRISGRRQLTTRIEVNDALK